jgi:hypothetical protein
MEMWLHEHPVNASRARNRQRSISTLWLWGGGAPVSPSVTPIEEGKVKQALFGDDFYVDGLVALGVAERMTHADAATNNFSSIVDASFDRAAVAVEAYRLPQNSSISTPMQAIEDVDRRWIAPAVEATAQGRLQQLSIVANDRCIALRSSDRFKFWRRSRSALAGLQ